MNTFDSMLTPPLGPGGNFNSATELPGGIPQTLNLPQAGMVSAGMSIPTSPAPIMDAGIANFGLEPTSGTGSASMGGGNLLDSPFENPLGPKM